MLFNTTINDTLNIFLAYGVRMSGKLRTDRYNFTANKTWSKERINKVCDNIELITGLKIAIATTNAKPSNKKALNNTRHIYYSNNIAIPLRFKPVKTENINIFEEV